MTSSERTVADNLCGELLGIAEDAAAADALDIAIRIARLVVRSKPSRSAVILLADLAAASGDAEEVIRLYEYMTSVIGIPLDARTALALGYAHAERGDFQEALNYFWRVAALRGPDDLLWRLIGSCYAMMRQFAAANQIFLRNATVPLADGRSTSTAILRLPNRPDAIRRVTPEELLIRREFTLDSETLAADSSASGADAVHLICCDSRYFSLFGQAVARSVALRSRARLALHFHIVNAQPPDDVLIEELRMNSGVPIVYTTETVDFRGATPEQIRTYYSCARFLLLPELQASYAKLILVTDADQTVIRSLDRFLESARGHDVSLLLFPRARYNLMALISASVCVANATSGSRRFFATVRDYILERMTDPEGLAWHLDQAALAGAYLACPDVDVWHIPPKTMVSRTLKPGPDDDDTLFWSVTYSIEANAQKLNGLEFLQFLSTPPRPDS